MAKQRGGESTRMSNKLRKSLSKDLPPEVLETIFSFLPEHVVCRFCVVCKAWNHLILQRGFASLHAHIPSQTSSILISPKLMERAPNTAWYVVDARENRCYKLPHDKFGCWDFGTVQMLRRYKYTLAADGGLIYTMYSDVLWPRQASRVHIVCNPVSKSFHEIPEPEFYCSYNHDSVVMSVDNVTKAYKILTMEARMEGDIRRRFYLYDSTTSVWKMLCEKPKKCWFVYSSIFMNDTLYTVFGGIQDSIFVSMLYSCNLASGAWTKIDVCLPRPSDRHHRLVRLVVSLNRLFMVKYRVDIHMIKIQLVSLSIWEIMLAKKEVVHVAKTKMFYRYSIGTRFDDEVTSGAVVAIGCANSILISSSKGHCVKFNLSTKRWKKLSTHMKVSNKHGNLCKGICTGLVDL